METKPSGWTPKEVRENKRYYAEKLEKAQEFQDFVVDACWENLGLVIVLYSSRKRQYESGESRTGVEIKEDTLYAKSGNLFIETAERVPPNMNYVPSGIFRRDNSWLYIIGNYDIIYVFSKKLLQQLSKSRPNEYPIIEIGIGTAKGFKFPKQHAKKYCIEFITFEKKEAAILVSEQCISPDVDEIPW